MAVNSIIENWVLMCTRSLRRICARCTQISVMCTCFRIRQKLTPHVDARENTVYTPVIFARFVCALLSFRAREVPTKSGENPGSLRTADRTFYEYIIPEIET